MDTAARDKLLKQVKRGKQVGAVQWTRLLVMLMAAAVLINIVSDVHRGKGSLSLLVSGTVMVFVLAMAGIGLGTLDMNERFTALVELIGEDKLLGK